MIGGAIGIGTAVVVGLAYLILRSLGGAASSVLADEFKASAPETAQRLIRIAARRLPEAARADMLETWLAEASQYEGRPLKALKFAIWNCLAAAPSLARQLRPLPQPASPGGREAEGHGRSTDAVRESIRERRRKAFQDLRSGLDSPARVLVAALASLTEISREAMRSLEALVGPLAAAVAPLLEIPRALFDQTRALLGPYDHSRPWWSVGQLIARVAALSVVVPVAVVSAIALFRQLVG